MGNFPGISVKRDISAPCFLGVLVTIDRFGGFHLGAVPDLADIPGHEPDIDPFTGEGIDHLITAFLYADSAVEIDPAATFHAE